MYNLEYLNFHVHFKVRIYQKNTRLVCSQDYLLTVNLVFHYSLGVSTQTLIDKLTGFYVMCISEQEK